MVVFLRRPWIVLLTAWVLFFVPLGCSKTEPAIEITTQTVDVACGRCIFEMEGAEGCPWAAHVNGQHAYVFGKVPLNHATHAPDGICNMTRQAIVEGHLQGDRFLASRFELLPTETVPEKPRFTETDKH